MIHDVCEQTQDNFPSSIEEEEFHECQEFKPDQDLESPTNDVLDFIASQEHSEDQLDQVLQTYHAYQETQSETEVYQDTTTNRMLLKAKILLFW